MENWVKACGIFIYPLGICSILAVFIIVERFVALRGSKIIPKPLLKAVLSGSLSDVVDSQESACGRILKFYRDCNPNPQALKAYADLEVTAMERGMFILDIVVGAAPLLGLLGTVMGLIKVFMGTGPSGVPDSSIFIEGIALALTTTMLGLSIAIPALAANVYLNRRIDLLSAQINVGVERLIAVEKEG